MGDHLPEILRHLVERLPFIGLVVQGQSRELVVGLLQAAIVAGIILYGTVQVLGTQMQDITAQIDRVLAQQSEISNRLQSLDQRVTRDEDHIGALRERGSRS